MLWRSSSFGSALVPVALVLATFGTGCGGCNDSNLTCDPNGNNCMICDAYGCRPANQETTVGSGGSTTGPTTTTGEGGATTTGTSTGGGGSATTTGTGGTGGGKPCDASVTTCPCDAQGACSGGLQCVDGLCVHGCEFSYECGAGKVCANGACVDGCDANTPCTTAGYTCDKGICVPDPNNPQCSSTNPCTTGVCNNGICTAGCTQNTDCPTGQICDATAGACVPDPSPTAGCSATLPCTGTGQVCGADGYCHYPCATVQECKLIDNRFDYCDQGICKTDAEVNPQCTIEMPCPNGQTCISNVCQ